MKSQALLLHQVLEAEVGDSPITIRALIPRNLVGTCIGIEGKTHRDLERQFETAIAFGASSPAGARLASIAGAIHQVARTWRECAFLMYRKKRLGYDLVKCLARTSFGGTKNFFWFISYMRSRSFSRSFRLTSSYPICWPGNCVKLQRTMIAS
jgi:hypothetical protein